MARTLASLRSAPVLAGLAVLATVAGLILLIAVSPLDGRRILIDSVRSATGTTAGIYALAAIGLNVHFGYTGLLNFGHVGFMLAGAYGMAVAVATFSAPLWLGLLAGVAASALLALVLGGPTLRLRADYLAIVTIAAAEILRLVVRSGVAQDVTGGVFGLTGYARRFYALNPLPEGRYGAWVLEYSERRLWPLIVVWGLVAVAAALVFLAMRSPWGRVVKGIREDEDAVRSLGKNVFGYKMQSLLLGGVIGGIAGMVWILHLGSVDPDQFVPVVTFFAYAVVILGGPARAVGPVFGSMLFWFVLSGFDSFLRQSATVGYLPATFGRAESVGALRFALVGLGLMVLMIYRPQGALGNRREMQLDVR